MGQGGFCPLPGNGGIPENLLLLDIYMHLSHLSLKDFRNYKQLDLSLGPGLFLFQGENAQGKTNLLEAVAMLATSNSFHASSDREIVNWHASERVTRIVAAVERHNEEVNIEIVIFDQNVHFFIVSLDCSDN